MIGLGGLAVKVILRSQSGAAPCWDMRLEHKSSFFWTVPMRDRPPAKLSTDARYQSVSPCGQKPSQIFWYSAPSA